MSTKRGDLVGVASLLCFLNQKFGRNKKSMYLCAQYQKGGNGKCRDYNKYGFY